MLQKVFEEHQRSVDRRFEDLSKRAEGLHSSIHELRNKVTALPMIVQRIEDIMGDLERTPRKEDLDHLSQTFQTSFMNFEKARIAEKELEKTHATRSRWLIGIAVSIVLPVAIIIIQAIAKKFGLL